MRYDIYNIGIWNDKEDFCFSVENMISEFVKERAIPTHIQIWYAGEEIRDYRKPFYTQQLFKTQPMDFLLKPIAQEQINDTIATAIKIIKRKSARFEFKQGREYLPGSAKKNTDRHGRRKCAIWR